jgi:hypothetical protein
MQSEQDGSSPDWQAEFVRAYATAHLVFPDCGVRLDLARATAGESRRVLERAGLIAPVCVITADNPGGVTRPEARNREARDRLEARLERACVRRVRCDGHAPDDSHVEVGWACEVGEEGGRAIAHEFAQLAIYVWDGAWWWVVGAAPGSSARVRVG